jgi:hypothetical protein
MYPNEAATFKVPSTLWALRQWVERAVKGAFFPRRDDAGEPGRTSPLADALKAER